ncbi:MAG: tetratricopeptide repeat protein [Chloroflexi bacterium]|nr:tetratricopeptide repeat protein [Chloroflexota bacterium]
MIRSEGRRLGLASVEKAEERVLLRLYRATGGAPLAIKWVVGQIKQKGQSLDTMLAALHEARGDIFEEVFARSWSLLSEEARRILMVMPIFAALASRAAIEAASDMHYFALDEGLGQLVEMWLVEATDELDAIKRRYSIHPLTRAYAHELLNRDVVLKNEARQHLATYFLAFAEEYGGKSWWEWRGTEMSKFDEMDIERDNILNIMNLCFEAQDWKPVVELMRRMNHPLLRSGYWAERLDYGKKALQAAVSLGDELNAAWLKVDTLGWMYMRRGEYQRARSSMIDALASFERAGNLEGTCLALRLLGDVTRRIGNLTESQRLLERALEIANAEGYQDIVSDVYRFLGHLALQQQELDKAVQFYHEALSIAEQSPEGNEQRLNSTIVSLATAMLALGNDSQAQVLYERGLKLAQSMRRQDAIAGTKFGLAKLAERQGHLEVALRLARDALQIYERLVAQEGVEARGLVERLEAKLSAD